MSAKRLTDGFIVLSRKLEKWYGFSSPTRLSLWIHLLLLARFDDYTDHMNGEMINLTRGQIVTSLRELSHITGISKSQISRYLLEFTITEMIGTQKGRRSTLITILRYNEYQFPGHEWDASGTPLYTKELKELKESKNIRAFGVHFNEFWNQYPKKFGKKMADRHFHASVKNDADLTNFKQALKNFLGSPVAKGDFRFIPNGSTWFNNWQDWINYEDPDLANKSSAYKALLNGRNNV